MINLLLAVSLFLQPHSPKTFGKEIISIKENGHVVLSVISYDQKLLIQGRPQLVEWLYESWQEECWPNFRKDTLWPRFKRQHEDVIQDIKRNGCIEIYNDEENCNGRILFKVFSRFR